MVYVGKTAIPGSTVLAPLAGVTDRSFRLLCREQGAGLAVTEMVSARGLADGSERSSRYLDFEADEHPISVQIFGSEPDEMAEGACVAAERNPDMLDINCGCPVKKIVNRRAGAALLEGSVAAGQDRFGDGAGCVHSRYPEDPQRLGRRYKGVGSCAPCARHGGRGDRRTRPDTKSGFFG